MKDLNIDMIKMEGPQITSIYHHFYDKVDEKNFPVSYVKLLDKPKSRLTHRLRIK